MFFGTASLAGLALLLAVVALALATLGLGWLSGRVDDLSQQVARLRREQRERAVPPPIVAPAPSPSDVAAPATVAPETADAPTEEAAKSTPIAATSATDAPPVVTPPRPPPKPPQPLAMPSIERVASIFAALLGSLTLLLGFVLFVGVALSRGWLGPGARMLGAFTVASAVWVGGDLLRKRSPWVGSGLAGAGFVGVLSALYATHSVYGFLGGTTTTLAMVAVCAVGGLSAARHDDRVAGHLSLIGALLTPVLLSTGQDQAVAFFVYLTLVTAGAVGAGAAKGWPDLLLTAAGGTGLLYLGWTASWFDVEHALVALISLLALSVPYLVAALAGRGYARHAGIAVLIAWPLLLGSIWLTPINPVFTDPMTQRAVPNPLGWLVAVQGIALPLLSVPVWLIGRARKSALLSGAATAIAAWHAVSWLGGWGVVAAFNGATGPFMLAAGWALFVPTLIHIAGKPSSDGVSPVPLIGGLSLATAFALHTLGADGPDTLVVAAATAALLVATALLVAPRGTAAALPFAALGVGGFLFFASVARLPDFGIPWLAAGLFGSENPYAGLDAWLDWHVAAWGPALVAVAALAVVPLGVRWTDSDRPVALGGAALAPLALGPALAVQWLSTVGRPGVGVVPLALGAVAALGATAVVRVHGGTRAHLTPAIFVLVALTGVNLAVPIEIHDGWLSVTLALELVAVAGLARIYTHPAVRFVAAPLALAVAIRLLANPYALAYETGGWPIFNWTLYTWGVPTVAVATAAVVYRETWTRLSPAQQLSGEDWVPTLLGLLATALGFAFVNVEVSQAFQPEGTLSLFGQGLLQGMTRSLAWGGYGMFVLILGWLARSRWLRLVGFGVVLLATAKVFLVDLWALSGFVRVGSVLGLGVFLIIAALLFERLVLREPPKEAP